MRPKLLIFALFLCLVPGLCFGAHYSHRPPSGTSIDESHQLAQGLVGFWLGTDGESGETAEDLSGYNHDGTLTNMDPPTDWVPGKYGNALSFDASDDHVSVSNTDTLQLTGPLSIVALIYPTSWGEGANFGRIVSKNDTTDYCLLLTDTNDTLRYYPGGTAGDNSIISLNAWQHVAVVYDRSNITFYVDGIDSGGGAWTSANPTSSSALIIGSNSGLNRTFGGKIEFVLIYNRALSSAEVLQLYTHPFCMFRPPTDTGAIAYASVGGNNAPSGSFNSAAQKTDGTGAVDISIEVDDADDEDCKAKLEYKSGADCSSGTSDPTLDEAEGATADFDDSGGSPSVVNTDTYQVGTTATRRIITSSGSNSVAFDWSSNTDIPAGDGTYCIKLTVNDDTDDQSSPPTTTLTIDNVDPSGLTALSFDSSTTTTATLSWTSVTETNWTEDGDAAHYEIWYDTTSGISQGDDTETEWDDTDDLTLDNKATATTTITGLTPDTTYYYKIWAIDDYGNEETVLETSGATQAANTAPTGSFNSATSKTDGSGTIDISIEVDDADDDDICRAKFEYKAGADCSAGTSDPTLSETDADTTADFGDPKTENDNAYQVGNASGWILTSSGSNTVLLDWESATDVPSGDGTYCIKLTVNDGNDDQGTPPTTTLTVDNVAPTGLTALNTGASTDTTMPLTWTAVTETNWTEDGDAAHYEVWYGEDQLDVQGRTGTATEWDDDDDLTLDNKATATTTITGLSSGTTYYFKIWAVDDFGNQATVSDVSGLTKGAPSNAINSVAQKTDGTGTVDISIEIDDGDDDDTCRAKIEYKAGADCSSGTSDPTLDETDGNTTADFGDPKVENDNEYQVGNASGWITTSSGSNTVLFDWDSNTDVPAADGTYCVKVTASDGTYVQGTPATDTLTLDNVDPSGLTALSVDSTTSSSATLSWSAVTETNFDHYEIWYDTTSGISQGDDTESEWDDGDHGLLGTRTTTSTTITGLNSSTTYYFKIWAIDSYGNEETVAETQGTTGAPASGCSG